MFKNYNIDLDRARCDHIQQIIDQLSRLLLIEDRPAPVYDRIRAELLEAQGHLHKAMATYQVIIQGQETLSREPKPRSS